MVGLEEAACQLPFADHNWAMQDRRLETTHFPNPQRQDPAPGTVIVLWCCILKKVQKEQKK
jgi:hypothetical protein